MLVLKSLHLKPKDMDLDNLLLRKLIALRELSFLIICFRGFLIIHETIESVNITITTQTKRDFFYHSQAWLMDAHFWGERSWIIFVPTRAGVLHVVGKGKSFLYGALILRGFRLWRIYEVENESLDWKLGLSWKATTEANFNNLLKNSVTPQNFEFLFIYYY